jgi:hypothetical protein
VATQAPSPERVSPSIAEAVERRRTELQRRRGFRRFLYQNGLSLVAFALFLLSLVGQALAGSHAYNDYQRQHGQPAVGVISYLRTAAFLEAVAENWESEFLQMGLFVLLTALLYQRGSSESKSLDKTERVDQDPREARDDPAAPWPVRHGGIALALYRRSLTIALLTLFAVSFVLHAIGGSVEYSARQREHGGSAVSALAYVATSQFWFESFQNWQSEFFSVGVLVLFSIWLRQQGSPQSKRVAASRGETGE